MAQYPIPQFIEAEAKIISFLTFKQFFLLVGGGVICIALYSFLPFWLFAIFAVIIGLLIILIGFIKIDGMSVMAIFLNFVMFSVGSKNYIWKKKESPYPFNVKKQTDFTMPQPQDGKLDETRKMVELRKK